jgi:hypothetical protein
MKSFGMNMKYLLCMDCIHCKEDKKSITVTCEKNHFQDIKISKAKYLTPIDFECVDFLE